MQRRQAVLIPLVLAVVPLMVIMIFGRVGQLFWLLALGILVGGVMFGAKLMRELQTLRTAYPLRIAGLCRDATIQRCGVFYRDIGKRFHE